MSDRDEEAPAPDLAWLDAKERGDAELPPLAAERAAAYEKLAALIGELPDRDVPEGWNDDVLAAIRAEKAAAAKASEPPISLDDRRARRRAPRWAAAAGAFALAAVFLLWFFTRKPPAPQEKGLTIAILREDGMRASPADGEAALGDTLLVKVSISVADELRVYRDERELVVRCPHAGEPRCKLDGKQHVIELPLEAPGRYRAVALRPAPQKPPTGDLAADLSDCKCEPLTAVPVVVR